jgi:hypothetical protein
LRTERREALTKLEDFPENGNRKCVGRLGHDATGTEIFGFKICKQQTRDKPNLIRLQKQNENENVKSYPIERPWRPIGL